MQPSPLTKKQRPDAFTEMVFGLDDDRVQDADDQKRMPRR